MKKFIKLLKNTSKTFIKLNCWTKTALVMGIILIILIIANHNHPKKEGFTQQKKYVLKEDNEIYDDFYVSSSNEHVFSILNQWPRWEKNFLNISGEKFSGKTHLVNIFIKKFKAIKLDAKSLKSDDLKKIKTYENIVLEDLDKNIDEKLIYSLLNIINTFRSVV